MKGAQDYLLQGKQGRDNHRKSDVCRHKKLLPVEGTGDTEKATGIIHSTTTAIQGKVVCVFCITLLLPGPLRWGETCLPTYMQGPPFFL